MRRDRNDRGIASTQWMAAVLVQSIRNKRSVTLDRPFSAAKSTSAPSRAPRTRSGPPTGIERENALGHAVAVPLRIAATTDTIYDCASHHQAADHRDAGPAGGGGGADRARRRVPRLHLPRAAHAHLRAAGVAADVRVSVGAWRRSRRTGRSIRAGRGSSTPTSTSSCSTYALSEIFGDYRRGRARADLRAARLARRVVHDPPATLKPRIAATEWGQRFEAGCARRARSSFTGFRQGLMWGEANDGNSFHAGGTLGNAGLFATARDVFRIAQAFVRGELVPRELVEEATRAHAEDRGLGVAARRTGALAAVVRAHGIHRDFGVGGRGADLRAADESRASVRGADRDAADSGRVPPRSVSAVVSSGVEGPGLARGARMSTRPGHARSLDSRSG